MWWIGKKKAHDKKNVIMKKRKIMNTFLNDFFPDHISLIYTHYNTARTTKTTTTTLVKNHIRTIRS